MTRKMQAIQVLTLLLVALYTGQLYAHTLELGPKMGYPPDLYLRLNTSLYAWYGPPLGAALWFGAIVTTGVLGWLLRHRPGRLLTGSAFALQLVASVIYFTRVEPANARVRALSPGQVPVDFSALRAQWEYGHATEFALFAVAFLLLVISVVRAAAQPRAAAPATEALESAR